ncbi:MAG: hypothetical protein HKN90_08630 [Flavobacteriaceae bacterium]|nr:hypothetical protein [Flavobacteriaceae bacterium]
MKNHNEEIDQIIKETLTQEEAKFYEELDELNVFEKIWGTFKGKGGWLLVIMNILSILALVIFIYSIVQFFNTDVTKELLKWAAIGLFSALFISMIKIYVWGLMHKNDVLRELKRIELQVAALTGKISNNE